MPNTSYTGEEEADFIEEDSRHEVINNLTDPEEIKAAQELIEEKYDESPDKEDTSSDKSEPKKPDTPEADDKAEETSDDKQSPDKTESKEETAAVEEEDGSAPAKFIVDDEFINRNDPQYRDILLKYKGKEKSDLAKAAANAVALKNPYIKDNQEAIAAIAKKIEGYSDDELLNALVKTQKDVGRSPAPVEREPSFTPELNEEDPEVQSVLEAEMLKRLKKIYPEMPDKVDSVEYREWEKDLQDEKGIRGVEKYMSDFKNIEASVKDDLKRIVYAKNNLSNLYNDSPNELMSIMSPDNLNQLKELNDNWREVNNRALENELSLIKTELKKYDLTPEDMGYDFTLNKDETGSLYNEALNSFLYNGENPDQNVIGYIGKVPVLKSGELKRKFIQEITPAIVNILVKNKFKESKGERARLKEEALNTLGERTSRADRESSSEKDITKITDQDDIKKIMADIEAKY